MCINNNSAIKTANTEAERKRLEEEERQTRIRTGKDLIDSAFSSYDDDFYNQRAQSYTDFAMPDLDQQFQDAAKQLRFALARRGATNSSSAINQRADMTDKYNEAKLSILDKGREYGNNTRSLLAAAKGDLLTQNQALADPTLMANSAATRIANATALPAYSPLGQIFLSGTDALATGVGLNRRNQLKEPFQLQSLFPQRSSARNVNS